MNNDHTPEDAIPDSRRIEAAIDAAIDALNLDPVLIAGADVIADHVVMIKIVSEFTIQVPVSAYEAYL